MSMARGLQCGLPGSSCMVSGACASCCSCTASWCNVGSLPPQSVSMPVRTLHRPKTHKAAHCAFARLPRGFPIPQTSPAFECPLQFICVQHIAHEAGLPTTSGQHTTCTLRPQVPGLLLCSVLGRPARQPTASQQQQQQRPCPGPAGAFLYLQGAFLGVCRVCSSACTARAFDRTSHNTAKNELPSSSQTSTQTSHEGVLAQHITGSLRPQGNHQR